MRKLLYILLFLSFGATAQPAAMFHSMLRTTTPAPSLSFQAETIAYMKAVIDNGGTWDSTGYKAIDTLVRDLKGLTNPNYSTSNIWAKFGQILPLYGGIAATHKFNLIDTSTYQATFSGSPTHSASGVALNGTSQFINSNYSTSLLSPTNALISEYYFLPSSAAGYLFGVYDNSVGVIGMSVDYDSVLVVTGLWSNFSTAGLGNIVRKFNALNYAAGTTIVYSNGVNKYSEATVSGTNNGNIFFGCLNLGGALFFGKQQTCKGTGIGQYLTPTENANYSTAFTAYETRLGRN